MKKLFVGIIVCLSIVGLAFGADVTQTATFTTLRPPETNQKFYTKTCDGLYAVVNTDLPAVLVALNKLDQVAGLEVQTASITATASALQTNTFATAFTGIPKVTATYSEDPGDVRPIFTTAVTASNVIFSITADKNYTYTAIYMP